MVSRSVLRLSVAVVLGLALLASAADARAWVELTVARDDVKVEIDRQGHARVEHRVLLLVSGGPLPSFVVRGVDPDATLEDGAFVILEKDEKAGKLDAARPLRLTKKTVEAGASAISRTDIEVAFEDKGISRGRFVVVFRYRTDLFAAGSLKHDGTSAVLRWTGPAWDDGLDTTRASFLFPVAPTEPRAESPPSEAGEPADDAGVLATVTRKGPVDVIELVRLYAAKGERVVWAVRADARAFDVGLPATAAPAPAPAPDAKAAAARRVGPEIWLAGAFILFVVVAGLVFLQGQDVRARAAERSVVPRPLIPLPLFVRAFAGASAYLGGVWLFHGARQPFAGAVVMASFALVVWYRPIVTKSEARAPGKWLPVRLGEVFGRAAPAASGLFHLDSRRARVVVALAMLTALGVVVWLARRSPDAALLAAACAAPLLALFASGGRRSLPVDLAVDPIPMLHRIALRVQRARPGVRLIPRLRLPEGRPDADEVRLVVLPAEPAPGLRAIEVGMGFALGPGGYVLLPEILLRFESKSACEAMVRSLEASGRRAPGRRLDERVLVFSPKLPTARMTAELVLAVLDRASAPKARGASPTGATRARGPGTSPKQRPSATVDAAA